MSVELKGISVEPGRKTSGVIHVAERLDGTSIGFPITIINGGSGPKLFLLAGVHGDEVGGPETALRLIRELDPKDVRGTLIIVPVANTTAFEAGTHVSPTDGKDLNRSFPGQPQGTLTDRLAHVFFSVVTSTLSSKDFLIDLHSGGKQSYIEYSEVEEHAAVQRKLADASGVRIVDRIVPEFGEGGVSWTKIYAGTLGDALQAKGFKIPHITIESFEPYPYVTNILKHVGILSGAPTPEKERFFVEGTRVFASKPGLWVRVAEEGALVKKGNLLANVLNFKGEVIEEIRSPLDGIVIINGEVGRAGGAGKKVVDPNSGVLGIRYGANVGRILERA